MKGTCSTTAKKRADSLTPAKKKKACSSSSTQERAFSPPPQAESHPPSGNEKTSTDPGPSVQQEGKRKISEISITSSSETSGSDDELPVRPMIHPLYTPESRILGRGPTHIAQKLLSQIPSSTDASFLGSFGWSDLSRRTCSSIIEGILYVGELVERVDIIRSRTRRDLHEGEVLREQLQATIDEAKATYAMELSESQERCGKLLKEKQEFQQLIEDQDKEIQKLKEELKNSRAELKDTKAQHAAEASSFKENFLKSEEFVEICGSRAFHYLEVGFEGAVDLFKAQGYPPAGAPTDFISLEDFVASLPPDL